jgi:Fe-S-cluster-containing hydrogenase component 2
MKEATVSRQFISADPSKCTGCGICELACALEKEKSFNPLRSRIRVVHLHPLVNVTMVCRFCENAPCVLACSRDALEQSEGNGVILVEEEKCDACGWCIQACPYGAIMLHPEKKVVMTCDLCGGDPECIDYCPEEALELVTDEVVAQKAWVPAVEKKSLEAQKLTEFIKSGRGADIFAEAEEKQKRLQEKLEALRKKELELYMTSQ